MATILRVQRAQVPQLPAGPDGGRGVGRPGCALLVRLLELAGAADGGGGEEDMPGAATLEDRRGKQVPPAEEKVSSRKSDAPALFSQFCWDIENDAFISCAAIISISIFSSVHRKRQVFLPRSRRGRTTSPRPSASARGSLRQRRLQCRQQLLPRRRQRARQ